MKLEKWLVAISLLVVMIALGVVLSMSLGEQKAVDENYPEFIRKAGLYPLGRGLILNLNSYTTSPAPIVALGGVTSAPTTGTMGLNYYFLTKGLFSSTRYGGDLSPIVSGWFIYLESPEDFWFFSGDEKSPQFQEIHVSSGGGTSSSGKGGFSSSFYHKSPRKFLEALPPAFLKEWEDKIGVAPSKPVPEP